MTELLVSSSNSDFGELAYVGIVRVVSFSNLTPSSAHPSITVSLLPALPPSLHPSFSLYLPPTLLPSFILLSFPPLVLSLPPFFLSSSVTETSSGDLAAGPIDDFPAATETVGHRAMFWPREYVQ